MQPTMPKNFLQKRRGKKKGEKGKKKKEKKRKKSLAAYSRLKGSTVDLCFATC